MHIYAQSGERGRYYTDHAANQFLPFNTKENASDLSDIVICDIRDDDRRSVYL